MGRCTPCTANPLKTATSILWGVNVTTIDQTEARLNTHEEVCALRYESICARLKRLEGLGMTVAGTIIMLLIGILLTMLKMK